jgi:SAD/SRA domain
MAFKFGLSNNQWNIGCHLVIYRDGKDSINWHADDTQGEDMVLSLTVDGPDDTRSICFQPANTKALQDLDEQIELFPRPGDAYSMDAGVQHGYVHAMLKTGKAGYESGKRMAIIFRNGLQKHNMEDNGKIVEDYKPRTRVQYIFGGMANVLTEGECYSREALMDMGAHLNDRGNIDGNKTDGCPSIIVCFMRRRWDQDHFHFLTYEAGDHSRPLAMLKSYHDHKPIRVFRSSKGNREKGKYFPVSVDPKRTVYRYDGLYYIICARSRDDKDADPSNARVFYMVRAEPSETMSALHLQNPAAREFLPSLDKGTRDFSERPSEDLHESIDPWSIEGFHDWNPHWCGL